MQRWNPGQPIPSRSYSPNTRRRHATGLRTSNRNNFNGSPKFRNSCASRASVTGKPGLTRGCRRSVIAHRDRPRALPMVASGWTHCLLSSPGAWNERRMRYRRTFRLCARSLDCDRPTKLANVSLGSHDASLMRPRIAAASVRSEELRDIPVADQDPGGPDNVYERPLPSALMDTQKLLIVNWLVGWEAGIRSPIPWSRGGPRNVGDFGSLRSCSENCADRWAGSGRGRPFRAQFVKFSSRVCGACV